MSYFNSIKQRFQKKPYWPWIHTNLITGEPWKPWLQHACRPHIVDTCFASVAMARTLWYDMWPVVNTCDQVGPDVIGMTRCNRSDMWTGKTSQMGHVWLDGIGVTDLTRCDRCDTMLPDVTGVTRCSHLYIAQGVTLGSPRSTQINDITLRKLPYTPKMSL